MDEPLNDDAKHSGIDYNQLNNQEGTVVSEDGDHEYDEDMQPWINNESQFNFYCQSSISYSLFCLGNIEFGNSVYHGKNNDVLTIKRRDLVKTRPKSIQTFAISSIVLGFALIFFTDVVGGKTSGFGIFIMILGFLLLLVHQNSYVFTTQDINLNDICFVERQVNQTFKFLCFDFGTVNACNLCVYNSVNYSTVKIGIRYWWNNISGRLGSNKLKTVEVCLKCQDAYHLKDYLENYVRNNRNNRSNNNNNNVGAFSELMANGGQQGDGVLSNVTNGMIC